MEELSRATGVGIRTLQRCFRRCFGVTVTDYLKAVRLDAAYHELVAAHPSRDTVTAIAIRNGCSHLGRFSSDYRERIGQLPKETLRSQPSGFGEKRNGGMRIMSNQILGTFILAASVVLSPLRGMADEKVAAVFEEQGVRLTTIHARRVSNAGWAILENIQQARTALAERDLTSAQRHTWAAVKMAAETKAETPTEQLRTRLDAATRKLEQSGKIKKSDLTPIYQQLDEQDFAREEEIRVYLANAQTGTNTTVIEKNLLGAGADVGYLEIDLALDTVVHDLRRAHHALWQKGARARLGAADRLLRDAQDQVHIAVAHASYVSSD